jgi:hypothetical protein
VGKCGRCIGLTTLPPSGAVVMKSGKLNFLETSGPLQACNRIALPFYSFFVRVNICVILVLFWGVGGQIRNDPGQDMTLVTAPCTCTTFVPEYYSVVFPKVYFVPQYHRNTRCVSHYSLLRYSLKLKFRINET